MSCPFCAHSFSSEPNCGHVLLNAVRLPARYITASFMENVEMGHRAPRFLTAENTGSKYLREEHIRKVSA